MDEKEDNSLVIRDVSSYYKYKGKQALPSQKLELTSGSFSRNSVKGQGLTIGGDSFGSLRQISQMTQPNVGSTSNQRQIS